MKVLCKSYQKIYLSSFIPTLLFWKTNKKRNESPSGTQNSIKTNALQDFSIYFNPTNRNRIGRSKKIGIKTDLLLSTYYVPDTELNTKNI